ncbi:unnamed protein product [Effrenium voratum]|uniref:Uncharacterized protein n=1 Tax=Effrenium voratum TaxID=2562239 RepID=A0AA36N920_9DINO|nr:unnamed protein product [Effrenium voratum]
MCEEHIVRQEDIPLVSNFGVSFSLQPFNFFDLSREIRGPLALALVGQPALSPGSGGAVEKERAEVGKAIGSLGRSFGSLVDKGEGLQYSRHLVDRREVRVIAGHGGSGGLAYKKHTKHKMIGPGWPCGGSGGRGGDVVVKATPDLWSLAHVNGHVQAPNGMTGRRGNLNGESGRQCVISVPRGVFVRELLVDPEDSRQKRRGALLADLDQPGQSVTVALGGKGGMGNNMARVHEAFLGLPGQDRRIELELKTVADVGLIGMPNAGKSTLLGAVSRACPKIAPYPFTTVAPYVGKVDFADGSSLTMADVPGLVEGAHQGHGLGHEFLRHLERTKVLLYVIDCARSVDPFDDLLKLQLEVQAYSLDMAWKPCGVICTKCDVDPVKTLPRVDALYHRVKTAERGLGPAPLFVRAVSARFGEGVKGLLQEVLLILHGRHQKWLAQQTARQEEEGDGSALVESLQFLHGLPQHFGAEEAFVGRDVGEGKNSYLDGVPAEAQMGSGELELTTFTNAEVQAKQSELLGALARSKRASGDAQVQLIQPLAQQAESATEDSWVVLVARPASADAFEAPTSQELEAHTLRRLTWEAEAERRARTDEPKVDEHGEEDPRPVRPDEDALEGMGFPKGARMHGFEEASDPPSGSVRELRSALSMEAHVWLAEQGLRQEMRGSEANKGSFELLEKCLALRLRRGRYRHFLRPPLVDVDVLVNEIEDPEKAAELWFLVRLPESYELLTGDLNHFSPPGGRTFQGTARSQDKFLKGRGTFPIEFYEKSWDEMRKHVYVIGQRFDAWENWYPVPIRRLCNMKVAFALAASSFGEPGTSASRARHLARVTESEAWALERQKLRNHSEALTSTQILDPYRVYERTGMHEKQLDGEEPQPWLASYRSGSPEPLRSMRLSVELPVVGFEVLEESEQLREALLKQLTKDGLVTHRLVLHHACKTSPFLFFSVYDEQGPLLPAHIAQCHDNVIPFAAGKLPVFGLNAQRRLKVPRLGFGDLAEVRVNHAWEAIEPAAPLDDATLLPEAEDINGRRMPQAAATEQQAWLTRRLSASLASHQVLDLACLVGAPFVSVTKHMHACAPSASFNGLLRTDLRQTPGELRGKPFQSYVLLAAAVEPNLHVAGSGAVWRSWDRERSGLAALEARLAVPRAKASRVSLLGRKQHATE